MTAARTVVVTGANSGIGRRAVHELAAEDHIVIAVCRDSQRGAAAVEAIRRATGNPDVRLEVADMAEPVSIRALSRRLHREYDHIDALINNAALFDRTQVIRKLTPEGHELFWATNHLGPFLLTAELTDMLLESGDGRVVNVGSRALAYHPRLRLRFDDLNFERRYSPSLAYFRSKLAQIMSTYALARRARGLPLTAICVRVPNVLLDPERVATWPLPLRLAYAQKARVALPPELLGDTYAELAAGPHALVRSLHGAYVDENLAPVRSPRFSYDRDAQERLWAISMQATGAPDVLNLDAP